MSLPASPADDLAGVVGQLYRACHLPPPLVLHARDPADFARLIGVLHRGPGPAVLVAGLMLPLMAATIGLLGLVRSMDVITSTIAVSIGVMAATWPVSPFAAAQPANRFVGHAGRAAAGALLVLGGVVAWAFAGPSSVAPTLALLGAAVGLARAGAVANGGVPGRLGIALTLRRPLPPLGMRSVQPLLRDRLAEALADLGVTVGSWGRGLGAARDDAPAMAEIATRLERRVAWRTHELMPLLGRLARRPDAHPLDLAEVAGEPPRILAAAARLDRFCAGATFLERAVIVLANEPSCGEVVPSAARTATPPAADATRLAAAHLELPFVWLTALTCLPARPRRWLLAKVIDDEPDPALRLEALLAMGPDGFFEALGRPPVDQGRDGALFIAGSREAPSALVRVIDQARHADGGERVHWLPVPPHLATAHEAVAWTFGKAPGAYRPSHET